MIWTPNVCPGSSRSDRPSRVDVTADGLPVEELALRRPGSRAASSGKASMNCTSAAADGPVVGDDDGEAHGAAGRDAERVGRPRAEERSAEVADELAVGVHLDDELLDHEVDLGAHRHQRGGGVVAGVAVVGVGRDRRGVREHRAVGDRRVDGDLDADAAMPKLARKRAAGRRVERARHRLAVWPVGGARDERERSKSGIVGS